MSRPCHYCVGNDTYEIGDDGACSACSGTRIHPEGDDPHDDGEGWDGADCAICAPVPCPKCKAPSTRQCESNGCFHCDVENPGHTKPHGCGHCFDDPR
jgi:hypothetical protein